MKIPFQTPCRSLLRATLVAGALLASGPPTIWAAPASSPTALAPHVGGQVLLKFAPTTSASSQKSLLAQVGGTTIRTFSTGWKLVKVLSTEGAIKKLSNNTSVASIQPNFTYRSARPIKEDAQGGRTTQAMNSGVTPNDPYYSTQWGLQKIGAPQAWKTTTGSDKVIVAVLDTGIDVTHPDLKANIWTNTKEIPGNKIDDDKNGYIDDVHGWNGGEANADISPSEPHGTHVAGIIGARGNNKLGVTGVNWQVKIVPVRYTNNLGGYTDAGVIGSIDYLLALRKHGVNVRAVNCSFHWNSLAPYAEGDSFEALGRAGVLIVRAAGNDNLNNDIQPDPLLALDIPNLISVGASDYSDGKASFSDYGFNRVHIFAPGRGIISTVPGSATGLDNYSGTSMATPMVVGAAALLWSKEPGLSAQQVKNRLMLSATRVDQLRPFVTGGRRLNLAALVSNAYHTVRGKVSTSLATSNGKPKSSPLAGVPVFLDNSSTAAATTDVSGNYAITTVSGGSHRVVPKMEGLTFSPLTVSLPTNTGAKPTTVTADFTAQTPQSKLYSISVSVNETGPDFSSKPRADVSIYLNDSSNPVGRTDKDGKLQIDRLPAGNYSVRAVDYKTGEAAPDVRFVVLPNPINNGNVVVTFVYPVAADHEPPLLKTSTVLTSNLYTPATAPTTFEGTVTDQSGVDYVYSVLYRSNDEGGEVYDSVQKKWVPYETDLEYARISGKNQKDPKSFAWKFTLPKLEPGYIYGIAVDAIDINGNYTDFYSMEEIYFEFTVLDSVNASPTSNPAPSAKDS